MQEVVWLPGEARQIRSEWATSNSWTFTWSSEGWMQRFGVLFSGETHLTRSDWREGVR